MGKHIEIKDEYVFIDVEIFWKKFQNNNEVDIKQFKENSLKKYKQKKPKINLKMKTKNGKNWNFFY